MIGSFPIRNENEISSRLRKALPNKQSLKPFFYLTDYLDKRKNPYSPLFRLFVGELL